MTSPAVTRVTADQFERGMIVKSGQWYRLNALIEKVRFDAQWWDVTPTGGLSAGERRTICFYEDTVGYEVRTNSLPKKGRPES